MHFTMTGGGTEGTEVKTKNSDRMEVKSILFPPFLLVVSMYVSVHKKENGKKTRKEKKKDDEEKKLKEKGKNTHTHKKKENKKESIYSTYFSVDIYIYALFKCIRHTVKGKIACRKIISLHFVC